ncbi:MAG: DUF4407 domain-containing protein [Tetrasphaera sp.]|nr:DUF4407 domain-containing protein [Tetrasphaera sp.]
MNEHDDRLFLAQMAGADPDRLRSTPEDVKVYTLLGSTVFISSGMAVVGMFVTLYFAFAYGGGASWWAILLIAVLSLAYGAIILAIDRMLVSLPLRSIDFVPGKEGRPATVRNGSLTRMAFALLPRFLLALTIGVLVAEPLLLLAFRSEVDARVGRIATAAAREAQAADAVRYQDLIDEAAVKTPEQQQLESMIAQRTANTDKIGTLETTAASEEALAKAEADGTNGDTFGEDLSGLQGCGPRCQGHRYKAEKARAEIKALETANAQLGSQISLLSARVGSAENDRVSAYNQALKDLKAAQENSGNLNAYSSGILIRIQALEQLARSSYPFGCDPANRPTVATTPASVATGSATAGSAASGSAGSGSATTGPTTPTASSTGGSPSGEATSSPSATSTPPPATPTVTSVDSAVESDSLRAHTWMGMTPLAMAINITRLFLIALDCMPILGKALVSLRKRRPYETAVARAEHNRVLEQLVAVDAAEAEADLLRASMRESRRAAFDSAGGAWVAGPWGDSFVGPDGSLTLPEGARAGIRGLSVEKAADGTWAVGTRDDGTRPRPAVQRTSRPAPARPGANRPGADRHTPARTVPDPNVPVRTDRDAADTAADPWGSTEPLPDPWGSTEPLPDPWDDPAPTVPVGPADPTRELPAR